MRQTSNQDYFFQSDASLQNSQRKQEKSENSNGNPIKLSSKILAIAADPLRKDVVYLAESSGIVRRLALEVGETLAMYKGPAAPLPSVCLSTNGTTIFAGCWDKTIWSWNAQTRLPGLKFVGHTDFVKSVICLRPNGQDLLVSGGADSIVIVWEANTGARLHTLKEHSHGIQDLQLDPFAGLDGKTLSIFCASSDHIIRSFTLPHTQETPVFSDPINVHKTSVYKLYFDEDGDLWTASADKTAVCLAREKNWKPEMTIEHPDYVKDIVVHEKYGWVITACRDEEVRIWNKAKTGELYHTYSGHFEEVTGLLLLETKVVSVSIDGTVRQWSLKPDELQRATVKKDEASEPAARQHPESMLTAEEEQALDDLLNSDSD
ncbi:hypothetical protein FQN57_003827 [Myotisia sp. PD_48]|nr:hypothetical protein FQN57_003827 [Myotisia sp. PD_48]